MRNKLLCAVMTAIMLISFSATTSCMGGKQGTATGEEDNLFAASTTLIRQYIDSLKQAKDCTMVENLFIHFQDRLDRINYDVAPETDLRLSEGQNDTLAGLLRELLETRTQSLLRISGKLPSDSTATDSVEMHLATGTVE